MGILNRLSGMKARTGFVLKKHSPEICFAGGVAMSFVAIFLACKATMSAEEVLDKYNEEKAMIEEAKKAAADPEVEGVIFTEEDAKRNQAVAMRHLVVGLAKKYWPVAACEAISVGLFLTSYKIINGRFVAVVGAYTALDEGVRKYRRRVADVVGEESEEEIFTGVKKKPGYVKEVTPEGETEVVEKEVPQREEEIETDSLPTYYTFSKETTSSYRKGDPRYNLTFIKTVEDECNRQLFAHGYVVERDVLLALGISPTPQSFIRGWIIDPANPPKSSHPISFNVKEVYRETGDNVLATGRIVKELSRKEFVLEFDTKVIWNLVGIWTNQV